MQYSEHDFQKILEAYPETITKEQLYKICGVSKKTAQQCFIVQIDEAQAQQRALVLIDQTDQQLIMVSVRALDSFHLLLTSLHSY